MPENTQTELATIPQPMPLATQSSEPSIAIILQAAVQGGITKENVEVVERLLAMQREIRADEAKREFAMALASLQEETGTIQAMTVVKNRDGSERYRYAKFEHIMADAKPRMAKHGFSHSFDTTSSDGHLTAIFTLTHRGGHSKSNQFSVRISKGQGTSEMQDDMGAKSFAKRGALCDGLGIVISQDDDGQDNAKALGAFITREKAADLMEQCTELEIDKKAFLAYANAGTFEEIPTNRLESLENRIKATRQKREAK